MDKTLKIIVDDKLNNTSIRDIMRKDLGISSGLIKKLKTYDDGIVLNGVRVNTDRVVSLGDELTFVIHDDTSDNIVPADIELKILYEDDDVIALNKPRNLPTHPSQNHYEDTLANGLMNYYSGLNFTFRAITRLDKDTSGIVLVAKNPYSAQILGNDMKNKKIKKEYVAVVNGIPEPSDGRVSAPIRREKESVITRCVAQDGKEAVTDYKAEKSFGRYSLVRLNPLTGRTHQLRVHMSYIGTPIYGDDLYGAPQKDEATRLHCRKLVFIHPTSKKEMTVIAPLPDDMISLF